MPFEDAEALSAESRYLQEKLGVALTFGLAEVSLVRLVRWAHYIVTYSTCSSRPRDN